MAGEQVMPRPPGPVTSQTPSAHLLAVDDAAGVGALRVHPGPAVPDPRQRAAEEGLDDPGEVLVRLLDDVEGERVLVLVGVADGQSAVPALHHQQLHPVRGGGRRLRPARR